MTDELKHETFTCDTCGQDVPWSKGAADNHPDTCDDCVAAMHETALELCKL